MLAGPATRTVTISAGSEQATLTVATSADAVDEADSTVTATVAGGTGYVLGSATSASVTVADDDEPPPPPVPEVTITAATTGAVSEGEELLFKVQAAPAPAAELAVSVALAETGAMLAGPATRTVTISAGSEQATLTVATSADAVDEADSTVTATVTDGSGYTLGSPNSAEVTVSDDDVGTSQPPGPPQPPGPSGKTTVRITNVTPNPVTEGNRLAVTLSASPPPTERIRGTIFFHDSVSDCRGPGTAFVMKPQEATDTRSSRVPYDSEPTSGRTITVFLDSSEGYQGEDNYQVGGARITVTVNDGSDPVAPDVYCPRT